MTETYRVKPLTAVCSSCQKCGLSLINCLCETVKKTKTQIEFWVLSSRREFHRPSNTVRLMQVINPEGTFVYLWERTQPPKALVEKINNPLYDVFLLFPPETEDLQARQVDFEKRLCVNPERKTALILIDGTWKEARKILRKSPYLESLPVVSIHFDEKSKFDLRKGADTGQFCTIEAAIAALHLNGERVAAQIFEEGFQLFLASYKVSLSGHTLKKG